MYIGHIMDTIFGIWTHILFAMLNVQKFGKTLGTFWTYLTKSDIFWACFGRIRGFGHILDIL